MTTTVEEEEEESKETAVTAWLKDNEADEFIDDFYSKGYYKIESVDDDAINSIAKKKPGLVNALKNSLAKRRSTEVMKPPKLPAGTVLDLSAPELKSPDGITFRVPKSLSVESTNEAIISPNNIKPEEWIVIVRGTNLLYAYDMDADEPKWAKTPVLDWKTPDRDDFARSEILHAKVTSTLTYSEETASYVTSGFDTQTATAGYAFCSASFERSHKEKTARSSETKKLIQVGMWKYPRVQIYLEKCTTTSERFINAVCKALTADDNKFGELNKVFKEYGHVIPSGVLLGGQLCYKESRESTSSALEHSVETTIKAAVDVKLSMASASMGMAMGSASDTKTYSASLEEFTSFTNQGGDSLLCTNPPAWAPTVKNPNNWAVIEMEGMRPTIDLLDPEHKQQVLDVWNRSQAILNPKKRSWMEGKGELYHDNGGFVAAMRQCGVARGSVQLISSTSSVQTQEGDPGTAAGASYAHNYTEGDIWIECNSICLPVPQGGTFRTMFERTSGEPDARLIFIPSHLHFGQWQDVTIDGSEQDHKDKDGFLFVSIRAVKNGDRGGVKGLIDGKEIAGSYVHFYTPSDMWIEQQSFCIPVPGVSRFSIIRDGPGPEVHAYWMPLDDILWKMQERVSVAVNTRIIAETDGILHGWINQTLDGQRGTLKLYTGDDAGSPHPELLPCAAASIHYYEGGDRWVKYSSVMFPVAKGTPYMIVHSNTAGSPEAQVFWTAIVPR